MQEIYQIYKISCGWPQAQVGGMLQEKATPLSSLLSPLRTLHHVPEAPLGHRLHAVHALEE